MRYARVLVMTEDPAERLRVAEDVAALGHEAVPATLPDAFHPDVAVDAAVVDADETGASFPGVCRLLRQRMARAGRARHLPVLARMGKARVGDIEWLLDAGADDCLSKKAPIEQLGRKLTRFLLDREVDPSAPGPRSETPSASVSAAPGFRRAPEAASAGTDGAGTPEARAVSADMDRALETLRRALARVRERDGSLGEVANVYGGIAPRGKWRARDVPLGEEWQPVVFASDASRFAIRPPESYLRFTRNALFRVPEPEEYDVPEKVLVRKKVPVMVAAVDMTRAPAGQDMLSVVPGPEVEAGYLAGMLNSPVADFYGHWAMDRVMRRQWRREEGGVAYLRAEDVRDFPLPRAAVSLRREFARWSRLLSFFGRQSVFTLEQERRRRILREMNAAVFELYGLDAETAKQLLRIPIREPVGCADMPVRARIGAGRGSRTPTPCGIGS